MKYTLILFILICIGCKKEETKTIESKTKQPIELVTDSTQDNGHENE